MCQEGSARDWCLAFRHGTTRFSQMNKMGMQGMGPTGCSKTGVAGQFESFHSLGRGQAITSNNLVTLPTDGHIRGIVEHRVIRAKAKRGRGPKGSKPGRTSLEQVKLYSRTESKNRTTSG